MRKLAREAVIFCLLGTVVAIISGLVIAERRVDATAKSEAMKAVYAILPPPPGFIPVDTAGIHYVSVPLTNGTILYVKACLKANQTSKPNDGIDFIWDPDCRNFDDSYGDRAEKNGITGWKLVAVPLGEKNQVAIEKEYWAVYKTAKRGNISENLITAGLTGFIFGFPAGFGVWCLYRLVRFAIFG